MTPEEQARAAWQRAFNCYIANALEADSLADWSGEMTVHDLAEAARASADAEWTRCL